MERVKEGVLVEEDLNLGANKAIVTIATRLVTIVVRRAISRGIARSGSGIKRRTKVARVMEKLQQSVRIWMLEACLLCLLRMIKKHFDLGCTYHMYTKKEWFKNLNLMNGGRVLLAENRPCNVAGIGDILIKMHDGIV